MIDIYIAHINETEKGEKVWQSVKEHCLNTAKVNQQYLELSSVKNMVRLACLLHDAGKYSDDFQNYIIKANENPNSVRRGEVTHSTAGAQLIRELANNSNIIEPKFANMAFELIRHAIISHHGFVDCITPDGTLMFPKRDEAAPLDESVKLRFFEDFDIDELSGLFADSANECACTMLNMAKFYSDKANAKFGKGCYYIGMCERLVLSYLTDADRTDTAIFGGNTAYHDNYDVSDINAIWRRMRDNLDKKLAAFDNISTISQARGEISATCRKKGDSPTGIFRLTVPTGGGKTFSVMSFALSHAIHNNMQHIIYVAPYNSILEQNADELSRALKAEQYILEHHCNVINESEADTERYEALIQRWNSPIILTSAVQLLNTLFSSKISSVRRFHALENSIIIFDEIQSLPIRCTSLFNLSVNYLTKFCRSSVVLCSATQPPLSNIKQNCMLPSAEIVDNYRHYFDIFKRIEIISDIDIAYNANELANFVIENIDNNMLIVVNTKNAARKLYEAIDKINEGKFKLYHLSTGMCAAHRKDIIANVRNSLDSGEQCICVSTQLIEAGVDISFEKVVRSLSGLDSIVQAGGRCNRHGEKSCGQVYVVRFGEENVSRLRDISIAQQAMEEFIYRFSRDSQKYGGSMLSPEAMELYYKIYFRERRSDNSNVFDYPCSKYDTTLVDLFSQNKHGLMESMKKYPSDKRQSCLTQAFKSAGDEFEAIEDYGKLDLIVNYKDSKEYIERLRSSADLSEKYKLLKSLQSYTVSVFKYMRDKLDDYIEIIPELGVIVLDERCYDEKFGISDEPGEMQNLIF